MGERIICGINTVLNTLERSAPRVRRVFVQEDLARERLGRLQNELDKHADRVERVSAEKLQSLAGTPKHQGVALALIEAAEMDEREALDFIAGLANPLVLVLDGIEDPRNYGACLRTADGAGVDLVVTGRSRGVAMTAVVSKVASGAAESQAVARVANLARFLQHLKELNVWIIGTDEAGPGTLFEADLSGPVALVMGGEGKGLRRLTRERCDSLVSLPMYGAVESLNISVAAGICLYEAVRQRG